MKKKIYTPAIAGIRHGLGHFLRLMIVALCSYGQFNNAYAQREPENPANAVAGLDYQYYEGDWTSLPNFDALTPAKTGTIGTPDLSVRSREDYFAIRYRGYISVSTDGTYTFYTSSDSGSKLFIGSTEVVNNDRGNTNQERSGTISLKAGIHALTITFFERNGAQALAVRYAGPGISKQTIPESAYKRVSLRNPENPANTVAGLDYQYYEGSWSNLPDFDALTPVKTGTIGTPDLSVRNLEDDFGIRYRGFVSVPTDGVYTFYTNSDNGSKLFIGSTEVVNNDGEHGDQERSGTIGLKAGVHALTVTFFERNGAQSLAVRYAGPGIDKQIIPESAYKRVATNQPTVTLRNPENPANTIVGLDYQYYEGSWGNLPNFDALTPAKTSTTASPDLSVRSRDEYFAIRFKGFITVPTDGTYTFFTSSDDGSKLFIGSTEVVNNDGSHGDQERSGVIGLKAGTHALTVTLFQGVGGKALAVRYAGPGIDKQIIPQSAYKRIDNGQPTLRDPENPANTVAGLNYQYYEGSWGNLPNFDALTALKTGSTNLPTLDLRNREDNFGLRYQGFVTAPTDGLYTFYTSSDDGSKLFIGSTEVVNNDGGHPVQERSGTIGLKAGTHAITIVYFEGSGGQALTLSAAGPGIDKQIIPEAAYRRVATNQPTVALRDPENPANAVAGLNYQYYEGSWNSLPNFDVLVAAKGGSTDLPTLDLRSREDNFGVRYQGFVTVPTDGLYTFFTNSDDGSKLFIGSTEVVNNDGNHPQQERSGSIGLKAGTHALTITYFEGSGGQTLDVRYMGPGIDKQVIPQSAYRRVNNGQSNTPNTTLRDPENPANAVAGLNYQYYEGSWDNLPNFDALTPAKGGSIDLPTLDMRSREDNFGVRYQGFVTVPTDGVYTFYTASDDGSKLFIGSTEVVNNDGGHGEVERSGRIGLKAGTHALTITYFEGSGGQTLNVRYAGPGIDKQIIPQSAYKRIDNGQPPISNTTLRNPENPANAVAGLNYQYYEGNWNSLPNFDVLVAAKGGSTDLPTLDLRSREDNFGVRYQGFVTVPTDGLYTFFTSSDDGSKLFIGSTEVVNNDGNHPQQERSGSIGLKAGTHALTITYFEGAGGQTLEVRYMGPGSSKQLIPQSAYKRINNGQPPISNTTLRDPENPANAVAGLNYQYYEGSWDNLPNFDALTTVKTGSVTTPNLFMRSREDNFGVRYQGFVTVPTDGVYTFFTASDDGSKLFIGSTEVVNNDGGHGEVERSGTIGLKAGTHALTITYFEGSGGQTLNVRYAGPGINKQIIPESAYKRVDNGQPTTQTPTITLRDPENPANAVAGLNYQYYEGNWDNLPNFEALTAVKGGTIAFPDLSVRNRTYNFAIRYQGFISVPTDGVYTFFTSSDNSSKLFIGSTEVVNNDGEQPDQERSGTIGLKAGVHALTIGYLQKDGGLSLSLRYMGPGVDKQPIPESVYRRVSTGNAGTGAGTGTGLRADYFNNPNLEAPVVLSRIDAPINFDWDYTSPAPGIVEPNDYSVRWTGQVEAPVTGDYTFSTVSDDGVRLWVNDVLLIDNWSGHGTTTDNSPSIALTAGQRYTIKMEYFEGSGGAVAKLLWAYPDQSSQVIPQLRLYTPTGSGRKGAGETGPVSIVYPIPTYNEFTLLATDDVQTIRVIDRLGRNRLQFGNIRRGQSLSFGEQLPAGDYLLHIVYTNGTRQTEKLLKLGR